MNKIQKYTKNSEYSYVLGAFPTWELINSCSQFIYKIYMSEEFIKKEEMIIVLEEKNIPYEINDKIIKKLADKGNIYVVGVFYKFSSELKNKNHVVLNEISDMGNLGTIIRTMLGFGIKDLALIGNVCDIFNPKVIRASMGSIFKIRFKHFETIEDYIKIFNNNLYIFMLSNDEQDSIYNIKKEEPYSIVMGNEGSGLPKEYEKYGKKVFIPQSSEIDSFNLPIATAIGIYEFGRVK